MRTLLLIITLALFSLVPALSAREWSNQQGEKLTAILAKVDGENVILQEVGGTRTMSVPLSELSDADKQYVAEWQNRQNQLGTSGGTGESVAIIDNAPESAIGKQFQGHLVKYDKGLEPFEQPLTTNKPYIALYYSAHWCGPCRAFTPKLVDFYKRTNRKGDAPFELIFVSSDRSEEDMEGYMDWGKMIFPAVKYGDRGKIPIVTANRAGGIPHLVILDAESGQVLSSSVENGDYVGPSIPLEELKDLVRKAPKLTSN